MIKTLTLLVALGLVSVAYTVQADLSEEEISDDESYYSESPFEAEGCTVAGIPLRGSLETYYDFNSQSYDDVSTSEDIIALLNEAEAADNISVILLEIDSGGGSPVAAKELEEALQRGISKPVVAQIRSIGASAAYYVATGADHIIASSLSDVGSIGVTMSYSDSSKHDKKEGFTFHELNTGEFKDSGSFEKPLTDAERELFERDIEIIFEEFKSVVERNRSLSQEKVASLADGSTMLGQMALENGLIDQVGGYYDVMDYIKSTYQVEPTVCW